MEHFPEPEALKQQWGTFIRQRRRELGITQTVLAERTGVDQAEISRIERGQFRYIDPANMLRIATVLMCPPDVLFTWTLHVEAESEGQAA